MRCMKKVICVDCAVGMKECNYLVIAFHKFISCRHEVIKRLDCFFYLNLTRKLSEIIYTFLEQRLLIAYDGVFVRVCKICRFYVSEGENLVRKGHLSPPKSMLCMSHLCENKSQKQMETLAGHCFDTQTANCFVKSL